MAWPKRVKTTPHTCGGVKFGRKTAGCPRCDELAAGAAPVAWGRSYANGNKPVQPKPLVTTSDYAAYQRGEADIYVTPKHTPMCDICCVCGDW